VWPSLPEFVRFCDVIRWSVGERGRRSRRERRSWRPLRLGQTSPVRINACGPDLV